MVNPWDKIFIDDFESGFIIANENYLQSADNFNLRARALCSLLIRNYQDALNDFHLLLEIEKQTDRVGDESYWDIALCYYALGNDEKAIDYFTFPVINPKQIKYTSDISIHAGILYFIAVKLNRNDLLTIATKKLKQQKKLVIPLFLLGQL